MLVVVKTRRLQGRRVSLYVAPHVREGAQIQPSCCVDGLARALVSDEAYQVCVCHLTLLETRTTANGAAEVEQQAAVALAPSARQTRPDAQRRRSTPHNPASARNLGT
jgi:hypothetical protein